MFFGWRLGSLHFLSRGARMYNGRCLRSSMKSILCTASWDQSRTIQTAPHCPRPESFSWTSYWTGCRLRFVVGLVDEIVGEGDSRSSWQVHEHDSCQLVSQQNVAIHVFWSRCHPRLPLIARDFAVHESRQTTGFSVLSWFVSSSTLKFVRSAQGKLVSRSIMIWDWVWLAWLWTFGLLNNFSIWFSSNFWTQLFHPIMFQRNLWRVTRCVAEDDCVRSCLIELQSFPLSKLYVTQYTVFWCPFHAFRMYCARRGAFNSIVSRCLCSLSKGSTNRKNTLCLLLNICGPGVNPGFMMKCELIAFPTW